MRDEHTPRVLIAKPGLDGHARVPKVVAHALLDDGMEILSNGLRQPPEMIVEAALQEDVDAIGLSILSGAHLPLTERVLALLRENDMADVPLFLGGIIPVDDLPVLKDMGVAAVFGPGSSTDEIVRFVREALQRG